MFESQHTSIEWGDHCHPNEKFGLGFGTSDSKAEKARTGQNVFGHKISLRSSNFNEKNQHAVPDCSNASFVDFRIIPLPTPSKSGMFGLLEVPPVILSFSRSLRKSYLRMNILIWQSNFHLEIHESPSDSKYASTPARSSSCRYNRAWRRLTSSSDTRAARSHWM
jgi:hypothetical protein